jgi:cell wall-associated NlpC family hydrolase
MRFEEGIGGPFVRLWGRLWLGLSAAAVVAAASGSAESALGAGEPPVRASAEAVTVLAPGAAVQGTGLAMAFGPAAVDGAYRYSTAIRAGWAKATAAKHQGASPTAQSSSLLRDVRLLGGAVRVRKIWTSAALAADGSGGVRDLTGGGIHGLVVLGRHVHPDAGATLPVGDWGTLEALASQRTAVSGSVAEAITGLKLTLLHDHDGLAAGTVVELATAKAAITTAPRPASSGNGGGSGNGTGGTAPPPPAPKKHPKPARHHRPAHRPAPRHHRHPAARRPAHHRDLRIAQATHALIDATAGGRAHVIAAALAQVGWPYIWGGDSRSEGGFDCSGLVDYSYAHAGMALPGRPTAAVLFGMSMPVGRARLQPGDLAFLYTRRRAPYHVALYVGDGLVVVAPHTGADVQIEPLSAVPWDGYGRLLKGGHGDGLARSVAAAARRYAHPGRSRLAAARAADALAARRVRPPGQVFDRLLLAARAPLPTTTKPAVTPRLVALASVRSPSADGGPGVLGGALVVLLAAACLVRIPAFPRRRSGGGGEHCTRP